MELSIIVPIYNVEKYLEECLKSLYEIKVMKKEIILVNDGSLDKSDKIIEKYKNLYPVETIVIKKKNGGLSSARNEGLKKARGIYVSFIDSDDYINPKKFEELFVLGKKENLDIIMGSGMYYCDIEKKYGEEFYLNKDVFDNKIYTGENFFIKENKQKFYRPEVWDDIYKREFLEKNKLFFREGLIHEDEEFTPRALFRAKKVKLYDIPFYIYRQRMNSITSIRTLKNTKNLAIGAHSLCKEIGNVKSDETKKILAEICFKRLKNCLYETYFNVDEEFDHFYSIYKECYEKYIKYNTAAMKLSLKIEGKLLFEKFEKAFFFKKITNRKFRNKYGKRII